MIDLTPILVCGAYPPEHVATLFDLPESEIERQFGTAYVQNAALLNRANLYPAGGDNSIDPNRPTSDTVAAFQAASAPYALGSLLVGFATYTNAQIAALFATTSDAVAAVLGAGPTSAGDVLAAAAGNPAVFPFANVTPATVAAFRIDYALRSLLGGFATYTNAQIAALFATTSDAIEAVIGAGPTSAGNVLAAAADNPAVFPLANVTPATVAAFRIDLAPILVCGAYPSEHIATLFNLPKSEIERQFGGEYVRAAALLNRANVFQAGGYNPIDPNRPTSDTVAAFQAASASYALRSLLGGFATYTNAEIAALFAITSDAVVAVLGAGPNSAGNVLAAAAGYPRVFPFANVTPATVAAFRSA